MVEAVEAWEAGGVAAVDGAAEACGSGGDRTEVEQTVLD